MRYERELNIFDFLMPTQKERSHEVYELAKTNSFQDLAFNKVIDEQKEVENIVVLQSSPLLNCLWCEESFERWQYSFLEISCKKCDEYMKKKYRKKRYEDY